MVSIALFRFIPHKVRSNIYFTYDNQFLMDGVGSQLQRILGIYFVSLKLGVKYHHAGFKDILVVSPVDMYQSKEDILSYLPYANYVLNCFPSESLPDDLSTIVEIKIQRLNLWELTKIFLSALRGILLRNELKAVYKIAFPFPIADKVPFDSSKVSFLVNRLKQTYSLDGNSTAAVIHFRSGFGIPVVFPGEQAPRFKPITDFFHVITSICESPEYLFSTINRVLVLTDAPPEDVVFRPPSSQLDRWLGTPLQDGEAKFRGLSDGHIQMNSKLPVEILRGGDPLYAIAVMAVAPLLVISKSSFGYVGALLNSTGTVVTPKDFWHKSQKGWLSF